MDRIPMSLPEIEQEDILVVADVLRSGVLSLGPYAEKFERALADFVGVPHAVAVSSGTAALHLLVRALGIGEGDEVIAPSFTFAASVNVLLMERARPVFVDIEPESRNLDTRLLAGLLSARTKALMVVDVFGHPADWEAIEDFAGAHDLIVIDDSCEALGAEYKGRRLGSFGHGAAFAFYANKQMTTGEGGMLVTENPEVAALCRSLRNQGRGEMGLWLAHERLGFNYRMDEMSAALGYSQFGRLPGFLEKRAAVAQRYADLLADVEAVTCPSSAPGTRPSWFVYTISLERGVARDRVMRLMAEDGVPTRAYFPPIHLQPYIRSLLGTGPGLLPVTEEVAARTMALPFHNNLTEAQSQRVVASLVRALSRSG
jgi:perosamine synthetase